MIINIFSAYVVPPFKDINNPAFLQEWRLNLDAEAYENVLMQICLNLLMENKFNVMIAACTDQPQ